MGTAQHDEVAPRLLPAGHRRDRGSCSGSVMGNGVSVQARAARFWELRCGPRPEWCLWSTGQAPDRPSPGAVHWCAERLQETLTNPEASHCLQTCIPGAGLDSALGDRVGGGSSGPRALQASLKPSLGRRLGGGSSGGQVLPGASASKGLLAICLLLVYTCVLVCTHMHTHTPNTTHMYAHMCIHTPNRHVYTHT